MFKEPGEERVLAAVLAGAEMSVMNFAEVGTVYMLRGFSVAAVRQLYAELPFTLVPVDGDLALRAALMVNETRRAGLSLGDRLCLALAQRTGRPALTADRSWHSVADAVGVVVETIR
ncbi:MAG TPA: PIN domain-containing protein [Acetobacteraceae bacterium]|nr:PIN domain-containing protein [Acetobacteraceae bacterium]